MRPAARGPRNFDRRADRRNRYGAGIMQDHENATPMRVLVAGCGYVGGALAALLAAEGHAVWGLRRTPGALPAGVLPLVADLRAPATLENLPSPLDGVVFAASPDESTDESYRAAYVDGVANLLAALRAQGIVPRRVLLTSTTGVYAQTGGEWVDEHSPAEATGFRGERPRQGERILLGSGLPAAVVRLGGIYGPGRTRVIDEVRGGRAVCRPGAWSNRIHLDDCAGVLRHLLLLPEPEPLYVAVDREQAELCEIQRWLADRLGVPHPVVDEDGARSRSVKRCRSDLLVESGYRFVHPTYREGFSALLDRDSPGRIPPESGASGARRAP
jgi:nucleoside-diphosphate-sugar epimerase